MQAITKLYDKNGTTINNNDMFVSGESIFINEYDGNWYLDSNGTEWDTETYPLNSIPYKDGVLLLDFEKA